MITIKRLKEIKQKIDSRYGLGMIERLLASNWYNPFATIWLNFRSFSLSQAWKLPVSVYGRPRFYNLSGKMAIIGRVKFGMITFNQTRPGSPSLMSVQSELLNQGTIIFRGCGTIGTGNKIRVATNSILDIGSDFKITDMVNIGCYSNITIGNRTWIVHRCQVLDANYHYIANFSKGIVPKWKHPIIIGNDCWICNSSTVTGGAIIPDTTIVASNSLVGKSYINIEPNSIIGGTPAKFITTGVRRINNKKYEREIQAYYAKNPNGIFTIPDDWTLEKCSEF